MKGSILNDPRKGAEYNSNTSKNAADAATSANKSSGDVYVYNIDMIVVLAIDACVFFTHSKKSYQLKNEPTKNSSNLLNHQNDVICFRIL